MTATAHEFAIINRCTRDGRVLWPHVAQQLGKPVHSVRSAFDPDYMRSGPAIAPIRIGGKKLPTMSGRSMAVVALYKIGRPARTEEVAALSGMTARVASVALQGSRIRAWATSSGPHSCKRFMLTPEGRSYALALLEKHGDAS